MITYAKKERAKYWPVSPKLMTQYKDGTHTRKNNYGRLEWWQNGKVHRDGDKPAVIWKDGGLWWFQNDLWYRNGDKPALIYADGRLEWYQNGLLHRFRGPAIIYPDDKLEWFIYDEDITQEVNAWLDGEEWRGTPEQIFEFQLRFA